MSIISIINNRENSNTESKNNCKKSFFCRIDCGLNEHKKLQKNHFHKSLDGKDANTTTENQLCRNRADMHKQKRSYQQVSSIATANIELNSRRYDYAQVWNQNIVLNNSAKKRISEACPNGSFAAVNINVITTTKYLPRSPVPITCEKNKWTTKRVSTNMQLKSTSSEAPSICANNEFQCNKYSAKEYCSRFLMFTNLWSSNVLIKRRLLELFVLILLSLSKLTYAFALPYVEPTFIGLSESLLKENNQNVVYNNSNRNNAKTSEIDATSSGIGMTGANIEGLHSSSSGAVSSSGIGALMGSAAASGYLDKLDNLERSVAAVLIKVAYGTTSTTKRSIPDNSYVPRLTTIATPLLTTLRYTEKSSNQQQINLHHRNYELDLERDHALPTSAPNADILKSNSNPTYPNPNRHHNHDLERHRHFLNSTPLPSLPNILKKNNGQSPTLPMYSGDVPSYLPPARSFFTPPLPPEYQNPFADKPTLRGTNSEGVITNTGAYINRRPIPPPSLMPGHERIPYRPPDLAASIASGVDNGGVQFPTSGSNSVLTAVHPIILLSASMEADRKKALNRPSRLNSGGPQQSLKNDNKSYYEANMNAQSESTVVESNLPVHSTRQEVLPSIRRILSGSNGKKSEIPEVLLKQATSRPLVNYHQPPSSPAVLVQSTLQQQNEEGADNEDNSVSASSPNINKSKSINGGGEKALTDYGVGSGGEAKFPTKIKMSTISTEYIHVGQSDGIDGGNNGISSTPATSAAIGEFSAVAAATSTALTTSDRSVGTSNANTIFSSPPPNSSSSSTSTAAAAAATYATWTIAWNVHVYLSVILFTILAVCSLYKMLTYNKLTHLFSQSYFLCIHLILITICTSRIFYLCYDAYNTHSRFHIFISELLLNLPATFLTVSFSVLILFLFLKSLNHKNNRYSALIRPLTVVVGCGVHVVLCITLHYVESYTMQNHQQHLYYHQQQQQLYRRQQQHLQQQHQFHQQQQYMSANLLLPAAFGNLASHAASATSTVTNSPPPRVLSLICQIIYIFICLSLGVLYLYLYRILKRILRSKSQNYIHGYQNLSYAIHITIATALLFVLLAALQIFGAISISTTRPLIVQVTGAAEIDWLQWSYQFSLRLIEITIITLMSWVVGLKTSGGNGAVGGIGNGDSRLVASSGGSGIFGNSGGTRGVDGREKHSHGHHHHHSHSNVAGFFLPCTSSSSQEQFDTDYPAVCNANTNLHTYTMRTGKLIYDSFALNSMGSGAEGSGVLSTRNAAEFQLQQQPTYQRPYDTGSLHSAVNHNIVDYTGQGTLAVNRYHQHDLHHQYADYLTDTTTDHYENPNFDLRGGLGSGSGSGVTNIAVQKFAKTTSTTSTTASSSGGSGTSSAASQQQMLLLQNDSCYSEPTQPENSGASSNYDFNNFDRLKMNNTQPQLAHDCWSDACLIDKRDNKSHATLERTTYENPERRSSNSTHSCASSSGAGDGPGRYGVRYNSFDRGHFNGVRKSGTLNSIIGVGGMHGRNSSSSSATSSNLSTAAQRAAGVQTLALSDRYYHHSTPPTHGQRNSQRAMSRGTSTAATCDHDIMFERSSLGCVVGSQALQQHHQQQLATDDDDMMLSASNVERTNLINNEDGSCITNCITSTNSVGNLTDQGIGSNSNSKTTTNSERIISTKAQGAQSQNNLHSNNSIPNSLQHHPSPNQLHQKNISSGPNSVTFNNSNSGTSSSADFESATNVSMLVAEHGFVRFRALDDINNAQGVGIHNAAIRNQNRNNANVVNVSSVTAATS